MPFLSSPAEVPHGLPDLIVHAPLADSDPRPLLAGLDALWCEHVVLFDFPRDPSEYVRRVGRTARGADGYGLVTTLALGRQVRQAFRTGRTHMHMP